MAANTLSLYVKPPLINEVRDAHNDPDNPFNYNVVCTEALQRALHPQQIIVPGQAEVTEPQVDLSSPEGAAQFVEQTSDIEYQISYSNTPVELQAFLDHITAQGAWPVSVSVDIAGHFLTLVGWPKVLTDPVDLPYTQVDASAAVQ